MENMHNQDLIDFQSGDGSEGYEYDEMWFPCDSPSLYQKAIYICDNFQELCEEKGVDAICDFLNNIFSGSNDETDDSWDDYWDFDDFSHRPMYFNGGDPFSESDILECHDYVMDDYIFDLAAIESNFEDREFISKESQIILSNPLLYQLEYSGDGMNQHINMQYSSDPQSISPPSSQNNLMKPTSSHVNIYPLYDTMPTNSNLALPLEPLSKKGYRSHTEFSSSMPSLAGLNVKIHKQEKKLKPSDFNLSKPSSSKSKLLSKWLVSHLYKIKKKLRPMGFHETKSLNNKLKLSSIKQLIIHWNKPKNKLQPHVFHPVRPIKKRPKSFTNSHLAPNMQKDTVFQFTNLIKQLLCLALSYNLGFYKDPPTKLKTVLVVGNDTGQPDTGLCSGEDSHKGFDTRKINFCLISMQIIIK